MKWQAKRSRTRTRPAPSGMIPGWQRADRSRLSLVRTGGVPAAAPLARYGFADSSHPYLVVWFQPSARHLLGFPTDRRGFRQGCGTANFATSSLVHLNYFTNNSLRQISQEELFLAHLVLGSELSKSSGVRGSLTTCGFHALMSLKTSWIIDCVNGMGTPPIAALQSSVVDSLVYR